MTCFFIKLISFLSGIFLMRINQMTNHAAGNYVEEDSEEFRPLGFC